MKIGAYQLTVVVFAVGFFVAAGLVVALQPETVQPLEIQSTGEPSAIEVREAFGSPSSTSEFLQGTTPSQIQNEGSVEQPSQGLLDFLQPNSGQSSFGSQDQSVQ